MNVSLWVAVIAGLSGILAASFAAYFKYRSDLSIMERNLLTVYDTDLRNKRIMVYSALWKFFRPLDKYSPPQLVTYKTLQDLISDLRQWYFETGGLFLSQKSLDRYYDLVEKLTRLLHDGRAHEEELAEKKVGKEDLDSLMKAGQTLRWALTEDVGTRKELMG
jgi:hypothetical protein